MYSSIVQKVQTFIDSFIMVIPALDPIASLRESKAEVVHVVTSCVERRDEGRSSSPRRRRHHHISKSRRHNRQRLHFGKTRQTRKRNPTSNSASTRTFRSTRATSATSTRTDHQKTLLIPSNDAVGVVTRHRSASRHPEKQVLVEGISDDFEVLGGCIKLVYSTSARTGDTSDDKITIQEGGDGGIHHDDLSSISMDTDIESSSAALSTLQGLSQRLQIAEDTKLELLQLLSQAEEADRVLAADKDEQIKTLKIENRKFVEAMAKVEMEYMNKICDMHADFHNKLKVRDDKIHHLTKEFATMGLGLDGEKEN